MPQSPVSFPGTTVRTSGSLTISVPTESGSSSEISNFGHLCAIARRHIQFLIRAKLRIDILDAKPAAKPVRANHPYAGRILTEWEKVMYEEYRNHTAYLAHQMGCESEGPVPRRQPPVQTSIEIEVMTAERSGGLCIKVLGPDGEWADAGRSGMAGILAAAGVELDENVHCLFTLVFIDELPSARPMITDPTNPTPRERQEFTEWTNQVTRHALRIRE